MNVYVDHNATTPLKKEVKSYMLDNMDIFGNASSMHSNGRLARSKIEEARSQVASLIGAEGDEIIFSSGGSESNNTLFETMRRLAANKDGTILQEGRRELIISSIEHPCILNSALFTESLGYKVHIIPVDENGKINIEKYKEVLSENTLFVSIMMANNEIGTIQDIKNIVSLAKEKGSLVHSDAVQAAGKIPVNVKDLDIDYLSLSAHKIYGPKGVGALYLKKSKGKKNPLLPLIHGGHQEDGLRAGTYNNLGILGFGKAASLALADLDMYRENTSMLKDVLKTGLIDTIPNIKINGHMVESLPNTLNVSFPGAEGEAILLSMDIQGIEASTGSACASGSLEPSHVLTAIGLEPDFAHSSIRFSLGFTTKEEDIDYILKTLPPIILKLRAMSTV